MHRKSHIFVAFFLSALCVASVFAFPGARYRDRERPAPDVRPIQGDLGQARSPRRFALPPGAPVYDRRGRVYPNAASVPRQRSDGMSPEQRLMLRRQINDANRDIRYYRRH